MSSQFNLPFTYYLSRGGLRNLTDTQYDQEIVKIYITSAFSGLAALGFWLLTSRCILLHSNLRKLAGQNREMLALQIDCSLAPYKTRVVNIIVRPVGYPDYNPNNSQKRLM